VNWNDLRFVLAVSQERSFLGAARRLKVTHTTVGRRIAQLEAQLGAPLFLRERNHCMPTPACARLVIAATRIEEEVRAARDIALAAPEVPAGAVFISSVHWIVNEVLLPAAPALHADYPGIKLRFYGGLFDGPRDGSGKVLSLRFELKPGPGDEVMPIARIGYALYGPAGVAEPERLPWVSFGGSVQVAWLQARGIAADTVLITVGDASAVAAAVRSGSGKGLIPECIAANDPRLRRLSGPEPEFVRTLRLVGDWSEIASARGQTAIDWMARSFDAIGCGVPTDMRVRVVPRREGSA
jgi:DNA-binding transcriptional LysR family regulator